MKKRDPIFWWASGIFAASLILFAITQNQFMLALMIVSYLLRPTLASLGVARRYVDERQLNIHYRSGNIGFVVMLIACVIFAVKLGAENNHDFEMFIMVIVLGLVAKALFNVILVKDYRKHAPKIIIGAGLLIALFGSFDQFDRGSVLDVFMGMLPGLVLAGIGLLSKWYARIAGILILVAAAFLFWKIFSRNYDWGSIGTAVIICIPLIIASVCLFTKDNADIDERNLPEAESN